jgi:tRNA threonylcarbamoyladenosine biosynthesis protein TsaE
MMNVTTTSTGISIELATENDTARLGHAIARVVEPGAVIGLVGPLGAGKTRLVRAIAEALEVDSGAISSPTFVLIHEYEGRLPVYHFDTYRLPGAAAFEELGVAEYWDLGGVCLVEWADRVRGLLPERSWIITIEIKGVTERAALIELPAGSGELAAHLAEAIAPAGAGRAE